MLQQILNMDKNITVWFYHGAPRIFFFDWISQLLNHPTVPFFLWLFIIIVLHRKKKITYILLPLFNLLLAGGIANYILKNVFMRIRPCVQYIVLHFSCPTDFSFPSGHATTSFAAAITLSILDPKRKALYYFIALFISFSRIYLGVHYLLDIMGGAIFAGIISLLSTKLIRCNMSHNTKGLPDHES